MPLLLWLLRARSSCTPPCLLLLPGVLSAQFRKCADPAGPPAQAAGSAASKPICCRTAGLRLLLDGVLTWAAAIAALLQDPCRASDLNRVSTGLAVAAAAVSGNDAGEDCSGGSQPVSAKSHTCTCMHQHNIKCNINGCLSDFCRAKLQASRQDLDPCKPALEGHTAEPSTLEAVKTRCLATLPAT